MFPIMINISLYLCFDHKFTCEGQNIWELKRMYRCNASHLILLDPNLLIIPGLRGEHYVYFSDSCV